MYNRDEEKSSVNIFKNGKIIEPLRIVMLQPGTCYEPKLRRRIIIYPGPYEPELYTEKNHDLCAGVWRGLAGFLALFLIAILNHFSAPHW